MLRSLTSIFLLLATAFVVLSNSTLAQTTADSAVSATERSLLPDSLGTLRIGTKQAPPFSMKRADGTWEGISIDLWREIALRLGLHYEFVETDLEGLIDSVADRRFDASVAALSITADRETRVDFSHPFYSGGLGIAVRPRNGNGWLAIAEGFVSESFLSAVLLLLASMLIVGALIWLFERHANPDQFPDATIRGVGAGIWWAVVTLTTVGYGDKSPTTIPGRVLAVVWMFSALVIVAGFTASLTSVLTVNSLNSRIQGPQDLPHVRVGALKGSVGAAYLDSRHIGYRSYDTVLNGLRDVESGTIDAMVHDAPIMEYWIGKELSGSVAVLPRTFEKRYYGIALERNSRLRKPLNEALLRVQQSNGWNVIVDKYLGSEQ